MRKGIEILWGIEEVRENRWKKIKSREFSLGQPIEYWVKTLEVVLSRL